MPTLSDLSPDQPGPRPQIAPLPEAPPPRPSRRWIAWLGLLVIALGAWGAYLLATRPAKTGPAAPLAAAVPTAVVERGSLVQTIRLAGQISAREFANITVPLQRGRGGGTMNLTKLVAGGTLVKKGDVVAEIGRASCRERVSCCV